MEPASLALGIAVGSLAGLLDYTLAAGFGLVSGVVLAGLMGYDPRIVAAAASIAEAATVPLIRAAHLREGNLHGPRAQPLRGQLTLLAVLPVASALVGSAILARLPEGRTVLLYTLALAGLAILSLASTSSPRHGPSQRLPPSTLNPSTCHRIL